MSNRSAFAVSFNGTSTRGTLTGDPIPFATMSAVTIEVWVFLTSSAANSILCAFGNGANPLTLSFNKANSTIVVDPDVGGSTVSSTSTIALNTWAHVAVSLNGTTCKCYINGTLGSTTTLPSSFVAKSRPGQYWGTNYNSTLFWPGSMSELRVWSVERTASDIQNSYRQPITVDTATLQINISTSQIQAAAATGSIAANGYGAVLAMSNYTASVHNSALATLIASQYAVVLNGSSTYGRFVDVPLPAVSGAFTVECWVNVAVLGGVQRIFQLDSGAATNVNGLELFVSFSDGNQIVWWNVTTNGGFLMSGASNVVTTNLWTHVAATINSAGYMCLYMNGLLVSSLTAAPMTALSRPGQNWGRSSAGEFFNGALTDLRVWTVERTAAEIYQYFNEPITGTEPSTLLANVTPDRIKHMSATGVIKASSTRTITMSGITAPTVNAALNTCLGEQLQAFSLDSTLTGSGLSSALVNSSTTLGTSTPTYTAGPVYPTQKALSLSTATQYLVLPYVPQLAFSAAFPFTVSVWANVQTRPTTSNFFIANSTAAGSSYGIEMYGVQSSSESVQVVSNNTQTTAAVTVVSPSDVNRWIHRCLIYNGSTLALYLNNTLLTTSSSISAINFLSYGPWSINRSNRDPSSQSTCYVSDARWYNGYKSPRQLMLAGPPTTVLLQQFELNGALTGAGALGLDLDTTNVGTPTYAAGPFSNTQALVLNNKYLSLRNAAALNFDSTGVFSWGGWFYVSSSVSTAQLMNNTGTNTVGEALTLSPAFTSTQLFYPSTTAIHTDTVSTSAQNRWLHVWVVLDGTTSTVYHDGVKKSSVLIATSPKATQSSNWYIGASEAVLANTFVGRVYDLRWYQGYMDPAIAILAPPATLSVSAVSATEATCTVTMSSVGAYTYYVSASTRNSPTAVMFDRAPLVAQTASQTVVVNLLNQGITYYLFVRAKDTSTGLYTNLMTLGISATTSTALLTSLSFTTTTSLPEVNTANLVVTSAAEFSTTTTLSTAYPRSFILQGPTKTVTFTSVPTTTPWTYEFWYYCTLNDGTRRMITRHSTASQQGVQITVSAGSTVLNFDGDNVASANWTVPNSAYNSWHHYAFVNTGTVFRGYQDGVQVGTGAATLLPIAATVDICKTRGDVAVPTAVGYMSDFVFTSATKYSSTFYPVKSPPMYATPAITVSNLIYGNSLGGIGTAVYTYAFNGSTQYGTLGQSLTLGSAHSIMCWLRMTSYSTGSGSCILDMSNGANGVDGLSIGINNSGLLTYQGQGGSLTASSSTVPLNTWTHVAVTVSTSGTLNWYINGAFASTSTVTPLVSTARASTYWGRSSYAVNTLLAGSVTELRVWSVERSAAEVAAGYNAVLTGTEAGLVLYFGTQAFTSTSGSGVVTSTATSAVYTLTLAAYSAAALTKTAALGWNTPASFISGGSGTIAAYAWTSSGTGVSTITTQDNTAKTALKAGTYSLLATDTLGITKALTYTVTENPQLLIAAGTVTNTNAGAAIGSIVVGAITGGTGTYTSYAWSSSAGATQGLSANTSTKTGLLAGTYTLTVTDSVSATASYVYTVYAIVVTPTITASTTGFNGSITLTAPTGGSGAYSYAWTTYGLGAGSTQNLTSLASGEYICTITSGNQTLLVYTTVPGTDTLLTQATLNNTLALNGSLGLSFSSPATTFGTATYATGPSTGTQGLSVSTGTKYLELPYSSSLNIVPSASISLGGWFYNTLSTTTYLMANIQTSPSKNGFEIPTTSGTTVSTGYFNANTGYSGPSTATLAPLNRWVHIWLTSNGTTVYLYLSGVLAGSVATTNMAASNVGWRLMNDQAATGTTFGGRIADIRWYSGVVSPARAMTSLIITPGALTSTSIGATTVSGGTAPYTVAWTSAGSGSSTISTQDLTAKTSVAPGFYTIKITDANALSTTYTYQMYPIIVATPTIAASTGSNGSVTLAVSGGNGTYTYAWTTYGLSAGSTQNLTSLASGEYICTITSGNQTLLVYTTVPGTDTLLTQATLNGNLNLGGTLGLSGFVNSATTLGTPAYAAGPYTGTQALAISATTQYLELPYTASLNFTSAFSAGGWFYYDTPNLIYISNVNTSTAGVEFTSNSSLIALNCYISGSNNQINAALASNPVNTWVHWWMVFNGSTVSFYQNGVAKGGGTPAANSFVSSVSWQIVYSRRYPGTYNMSNGKVADVRFYSGVVSAARAMQTLIINPAAVTLGAGSTNSIGATTVSGGTAPYTVLWTSTGSGSSTISTQDLTAKTGLAAGFYTLKVTDANALSTTYTYQIAPLLVVSAAITASTGTNGSITLTVSGGTGAYTYAWTNYGVSAGSSQNLSGLFSGEYVCTVVSGTQTSTVVASVPGSDLLLSQASFNGTLAVTSLPAVGITGFASTTGLAAPNYTSGPVAGVQSLSLITSNILVLPYSASLGFTFNSSFSVGGWLYASDTSTQNWLHNMWNTTTGGLYFQVWNSNLNWQQLFYNNSGNPTKTVGGSMSSSSVGVWRHYWVTYDASTQIVRLYTDGVLFATSTALLYDFYSADPWRIRAVTGAVADVRWYSGIVNPRKAMAPLLFTASTVTWSTTSGYTIAATTANGGTRPYTAVWTSSNGGTTITAQDLTAKAGLSAGSYTVVVKDAAGLSTSPYTYTLVDLVITPGTITNNTLNGGTAGSIGATTVSGGSGIYSSYVWTSSNGGTTGLAATLAAKTGLRAGTYTLVVTDSAGVTATKVYTLVDPLPLTVASPSLVTGVAVAGGSTGTIGPVNTLTLNGSTQYGIISQPCSVGATITVEFWMKVATIPSTYTRIFECFNTSADAITLNVINGFLYQERNWSAGVSSGYALTLNNWVHIAYAVTGTTAKFYVNGALFSTVTIGALTIVTRSTTYWGNCYGAAAPFGGTLTEMRLWSVERTAAQIAAAFRAPLTGTETGLVHCFGTRSLGAVTSGGIVYDISPNNYTMTIAAYTAGASVTNNSTLNWLAPSGGSGTYVYTWSGTSTSTLVNNVAYQTGLKVGPYTCVIGDSAGATATQVYTVGTALAITPGTVVPGTTTGAIGATTVTGAYTSVLWISSGTGATTGLSGLAAQPALAPGTYTVVVRDSATGSVAVYSYVATTILIATPLITPATTGVNGAITLSISGGTGTNSYAWTYYGTSTGSNNQTLTGLFAGEYSCTVTSGTQTVVVNAAVPGNDVLLAQAPLNGSLTLTGSLGLSFVNPTTTLGSAASYGVGPFTGTQAINMATASYLILPYTAVLNNSSPFSFGCWVYISGFGAQTTLFGNVAGTNNTGLEIYVNTGPSTPALNVFVSGANYAATTNTSVSTIPNTWVHFCLVYDGTLIKVYQNGTLCLTSAATTPQSITTTVGWGLKFTRATASAYPWSGKIADARWYSGVVSPQRAMISLVITPGAITTTSIGATTVAGGTAPYTAVWTSTATAITTQDLTAKTGLAPGFYNVKVTDANALSTTFTYQVVALLVVTPTTTPASTGNNGTINLTVNGGTGVNVFSWNYYGVTISTAQNLTGLFTGTYTCTVTSGTQTQVVTVVMAGTGSSLLAQATLNGTLNVSGNLGLAFVNSSVTLGGAPTYTAGPVAGTQGVIMNSTFLQLPYNATLNFTNLAPFSFGCWIYQTSTPDSHAMCNSSVGGIEIEIWSSGSNLTINIRDVNGNRLAYIASFAMSSNSLGKWRHYWVVYNGDTMAVYVDTVLMASLSVSTLPFTSSTGWLLGKKSTKAFTGAIADARWYYGAVSPQRALASEDFAGTVTNASYYQVSNGSISAPGTAFGTAPYSYSWSDNAFITTASRTGLAPGTYVCTIKDALQVTKQYSYTITAPAQMAATLTVVNNTVYDGTQGSITASALSGGTAPYTVLWSTGSTSMTSITGLSAGSYTFAMTDALGYTAQKICTVTEPVLSASTSTSTPISVLLQWTATSAGSIYQVDYTGPGGTVTNAAVTSQNTATIVGLTPSTSYVFSIFKVINRQLGTRKILSTVTGSTTALVDNLFSKAAYQIGVLGSKPVYDLKKVNLATSALDVTKVFASNDLVKVTTRVKQTEPAIVVSNQTTLAVKKLQSVILPFEPTLSGTQQVILSETSSTFNQTIGYNSSTNSISVQGVQYKAGTGFRVGGYKINVCDTL